MSVKIIEALVLACTRLIEIEKPHKRGLCTYCQVRRIHAEHCPVGLAEKAVADAIKTDYSSQDLSLAMKREIAQAIAFIHRDEAEGGNYEAGMEILCRLIGHPVKRTKVRSLNVIELMRLLGKEEGTKSDGR